MSEDGSYYPSQVCIYFDKFFPVRLFFRLRAHNRVCVYNNPYKHPQYTHEKHGVKIGITGAPYRRGFT